MLEQRTPDENDEIGNRFALTSTDRSVMLSFVSITEHYPYCCELRIEMAMGKQLPFTCQP